MMAKNDEWCEFCDDKIKATVVHVKGIRYHVCRHCESLTIQDEDVVNDSFKKDIVKETKSKVEGKGQMSNAPTPTKKQLDFIDDIQEFVNEKFTGSTKAEASAYIQRNIKEFKLFSQSNFVTINGYD